MLRKTQMIQIREIQNGKGVGKALVREAERLAHSSGRKFWNDGPERTALEACVD